jgi:hypothetical protein
MRRNRKLVVVASTLLVLSAVVVPQERIAGASAIVHFAQFIHRVLPGRVFSFPQVDPTWSAVPLTRQPQEVL